MAHYYELDWANQYGVPSHLIRVSVGFEDIDVSLIIYLSFYFILILSLIPWLFSFFLACLC
jgi:hypothetical protein